MRSLVTIKLPVSTTESVTDQNCLAVGLGVPCKR